MSRAVQSAQRLLADVVATGSGLARLCQAIEAGKIVTSKGTLDTLRRSRNSLESLAVSMGNELGKLREHERSVAP